MTWSLKTILFIAVAAVQIYAPVSMIVKHEHILKEGKVFKFQTAPVDPADIFRGRYVWLRFKEDKAHAKAGSDWYGLQTAYAQIVDATGGFSKFGELYPEPPADGDYLAVSPGWIDGPTAYIHTRLDRYYMPEAMAPEAEAEYRAHSLGNQSDAFVTVRVLNGEGVLEELYIGGLPVKDFLRQQAKQEAQN